MTKRIDNGVSAPVYEGTLLAATPAAPPAGSGKLYFKSDNQLYRQTPAGAESLVGSGGGGGGVLTAKCLAVSNISLSTGSSAGAYAPAVLTDTPLVHYRMGEASGTTVADSSGNSRNATSTNVTLGASGLIVGDANTAYSFNGSTASVVISSPSFLGAATISIEAWIKTTASGIMSIVDRDPSIGRIFQFRLNNGILEFVKNVSPVVTVTSGSVLVNDGAAHHVAVTYDATTVRLYVDAVQVGTTTTSGSLAAGSSVWVGIGASFNNTSALNYNYFNGIIDEVAIYSTALTGARITAHYANGAPSSGTLYVDGVTLNAGDKVLAIGQTSPADNGLWTVVVGGSWTRTSDTDTSSELSGKITFVEDGVIFNRTHWLTTFSRIDTLGTTAISWVPIDTTNTYKVKVASTTNIALTSATTSIDSITLSPGDRVLVTGQTTPSTNGVYIVTLSGSWVRASNLDSSAELSGVILFVEQGALNQNTRWTTNFRSTDTLNTTDMFWSLLATGSGSTSVVSSPGTGVRYFYQDNADVGSGTVPVTYALIPGMTLTIPSSLVARKGFVSFNFNYTGAHTNRAAIYLDGAIQGELSLGNLAGSNTAYDHSIANYPITLSAGSAHVIEIRWQASDSTAAVTITDRALVVDVYDASSSPILIGGGFTNRDRRWSVGAAETSIDEFNDDSIDTAWVRMDGTGAAVGNQSWAEGADALSGKNNGSDTSGKYHALVRPIGTSMVVGDAFVTAMNVLGFHNTTTYSLIGGLFLTTNATFGSGEQVAGISYYDQNADRWISETTTITGNAGVADSGLVLLGLSNPGLHYLRLVYIAANTWRTDVSPDGVSWITGSNISKTMTPTHIGFCSSSKNANQSISSFEFLRRVSGIT